MEQKKATCLGGSPPLPRHVAIIMDGNGRWAAQRGLPRAEGHRRGVDSVRRTVEASVELRLEYLTIYSFSSENWSRPENEISHLMRLLKRFIRQDLASLHEQNVKIRVIGQYHVVDPEISSLIEEACELTSGNSGLNLTVAFNYGSREEIVFAVQRIAQSVKKGALQPADVTAELIGLYLDAPELPDPDLLIRTSGEMRLSNFLLWQCAYTEFVFLDVHWPDFDRRSLMRAIEIYHSRERRFGGLSARSSA
ncbi:MAG: isoprenyl transferase [Methyloligellaceae bacterium]